MPLYSVFCLTFLHLPCRLPLSSSRSLCPSPPENPWEANLFYIPAMAYSYTSNTWPASNQVRFAHKFCTAHRHARHGVHLAYTYCPGFGLGLAKHGAGYRRLLHRPSQASIVSTDNRWRLVDLGTRVCSTPPDLLSAVPARDTLHPGALPLLQPHGGQGPLHMDHRWVMCTVTR